LRFSPSPRCSHTHAHTSKLPHTHSRTGQTTKILSLSLIFVSFLFGFDLCCCRGEPVSVFICYFSSGFCTSLRSVYIFFSFFVSLAAVGSFLNSNNHGDYLKFGWANSMHRYFARTHKRLSRPFSLAHSWSEENAHLTVCLKFCFKIRSNSSNCTEIGFFPATLTVTDVFQTFFNGTRENTCSTNRG